jgi:hypothetical protein
MKFKLLSGLALVLVIAALYGWWRIDLRWRPETIDKNVAEITKLVEQSGWVSPGLGGPKLYMIGYRDCAACTAYKAQEFPTLQAASVDTRLIEIARADDKGASHSTLAERSTVAELWVNRSWALSQRWDAAAPGAWTAEGITPADTDVARSAVVEAGRKMTADLAPLLKANGIGAGYPILIWWDKEGRMRGCACDKAETYRYLRSELGAKS